jgi:hypothetical protein
MRGASKHLFAHCPYPLPVAQSSGSGPERNKERRQGVRLRYGGTKGLKYLGDVVSLKSISLTPSLSPFPPSPPLLPKILIR